MKNIRQRLRVNSDEGGFSLVEVVVAMMIFTLISTGLLYTMMSVLVLNRDTRVRQVAANLAAEEIDRAREVLDVKDLEPWNTDSNLDDENDPLVRKGPITINGDTFHIKREVQWVSDPESSLQCGASSTGTTLRYKRVNVLVTWDGMRSPQYPVRADTVINPRARVNDPLKGALLISVLDANGNGVAGVTPIVTPNSGVVAEPTDAEGCSYLLNVTPATYKIALSKSGYVNQDHVAAPSVSDVIVAAGFTNSRTFQYAAAGVYKLVYPASKSTTMPTSFISSDRTYVSAANVAQLSLFPLAYKIVAGDSNVCPASDPAKWSVGDDGGDPANPLVPNDPQPYIAAPGGNISVPMQTGIATVSSLSSTGYLRAISTSGDGHPDCTSQTTYNFPAGQKTISLPYGTWRLYKVTSANVQSGLSDSDISLGTYGRIKSNGTVTFDPRTLTVG